MRKYHLNVIIVLISFMSLGVCCAVNSLDVINASDKHVYAILDTNANDAVITANSEVTYIPPGGRGHFSKYAEEWFDVAESLVVYIVDFKKIEFDLSKNLSESKIAEIKPEYVLDTIIITREAFESAYDLEVTYPQNAYTDEQTGE